MQPSSGIGSRPQMRSSPPQTRRTRTSRTRRSRSPHRRTTNSRSRTSWPAQSAADRVPARHNGEHGSGAPTRRSTAGAAHLYRPERGDRRGDGHHRPRRSRVRGVGRVDQYLKGCRASVGWLGPVQPGARRVDLDGAAAPRRTAHRDRPTEPQVTASAAPELVIVGGAELDVAPADLAGPDRRIHSYPG